MRDLLARVIAWSIVMGLVTFLMSVIMSFVTLDFAHPFSSEIGRAVWACFGIWFGRYVIRHEFGDE